MENKLSLLITVLVLSISNCFSQTTEGYNLGGLPSIFGTDENSEQTAQKYKNAEINLEKAYNAYEEGDLEKTKYYLDQSEKKGVVSPGFYLLLGQYFYVKNQFNYAERYWKRGFKKGCYECQEKLQSIPVNK